MPASSERAAQKGQRQTLRYLGLSSYPDKKVNERGDTLKEICNEAVG